jgi:hypothetical protein
MQKFMKTYRPRLLVVVVLVSALGLATFAVAQSSSGSSFNLNSPAAFPVDI